MSQTKLNEGQAEKNEAEAEKKHDFCPCGWKVGFTMLTNEEVSRGVGILVSILVKRGFPYSTN